MEFFDVLNRRRSVRSYKPDVPERELILKALDAANRAPSAGNKKPWEVVVAGGENVRKVGESLKGVLEQVYTGTDEKAMAFKRFAADFGGAPYLIVMLSEQTGDPRYKQAYLESVSAAMQNLLLAAAALGLGTCWMTGPLMDEQGLRRILDIEANKDIVAVTPIGYPSDREAFHTVPLTDIKVRWVE